MNESLFHRLKILVLFEIHNFEKSLTRLRASHYPSSVAHNFINDLAADLQTLRDRVAQIVEDFPDDPKGAGEMLRSEHRKSTERLTFLDSLENAQTQAVPWSLIPSVERLSSYLLPKKQLLTTCANNFNYGIRWFRRETSPTHRYCILQLPASHRTNAFLHILVVHELFHPILDEFFSEKTAGVFDRLKTACEPLVEKYEDRGSLFRKPRLDEVVEVARHVWLRALEEIMCDMGCAAVFGPAALFAASSFALPSNLDELPAPEGQLYPPWRYRLRSVFKFALDQSEGKEALGKLDSSLRRNSFEEIAELLRAQLNLIVNEAQRDDDLKAIDESDILKVAYKEVGNSLSDAWEYVKGKAKAIQESWINCIDEVPQHLRSLELLVPPSEIHVNGERLRSPGSLPAIAIASWLFELQHEIPSDEISDHHQLDHYRRSCRLMLKAFEDVELKRQFDDRPNE